MPPYRSTSSPLPKAQAAPNLSNNKYEYIWTFYLHFLQAKQSQLFAQALFKSFTLDNQCYNYWRKIVCVFSSAATDSNQS